MALYLRIGRRILHSRVAINSFAFHRQNGRHSVPALQKLFPAITARGTATESRRAEGAEEKPVHASEEHVEVTNSESDLKKDEHQDEKDHTALGGFMRGLIGGQTVAAQDEYVAEAKKQGLDIPPPPPPRRADLVPIKRRKRAEEESEEPQSIRDRLFSRFSGSAFMRGAFEAKERISERIDESNNPVVNFFRNIYDNVFAENEMAMVIREIREEDKNFTISEFLREVETVHVPSILGAYLTGDREKLKTLCTEEAYNMLNLSIREREQAKVTMDPNLLAISEVELSAARLLEDAPVLIVSFSTQQINCLRDPTGAVVEGKEDDIRALYYVWALVREVEYEEAVPTGGGLGSTDKKSAEKSESDDEPSHSSEDGDKSQKSSETKSGDNSAGPPPWKMMEMVIRGAHSTI